MNFDVDMWEGMCLAAVDWLCQCLLSLFAHVEREFESLGQFVWFVCVCAVVMGYSWQPALCLCHIMIFGKTSTDGYVYYMYVCLCLVLSTHIIHHCVWIGMRAYLSGTHL